MQRTIRIIVAFAFASVSGAAMADPGLVAVPLRVATAPDTVASDTTARPARGVPGGGYIAGGILAGVAGVAVLLFSQDDDADSN